MKVFQNFPFRNVSGRTSLASLSARHIITPRRAGITLASAFACVGIASAMNAGATNNTGGETSQAAQDHTVQLKLEKKDSSSSTPSDSAGATPDPLPEQPAHHSSVSFQQSITASGDSTPSTTHKLTVNGKEVPVPKNGTVKKVITNKDGNTSVHITSNVSGSTNNTSSSSISVNVSSDSSSSNSNDVGP